jgi:eukaryotic-like serine/threonine-protein kinase
MSVTPLKPKPTHPKPILSLRKEPDIVPLTPTKIIGRYALYEAIASGGMATVYYGTRLGAANFSRAVAIKRMHQNLTSDNEFVTMFMEEARLAARIRHPNVVATSDVVCADGELFLVMDYIHGVPLSRVFEELSKGGTRCPLSILVSLVLGAAQGLHAAHTLEDENGVPLRIVHRDVSPQNLLVGSDGVVRVVDFGIAKAVTSTNQTEVGVIKGKIAYLAPEQLLAGEALVESDIFSLAAVAWELATNARMRPGRGDAAHMMSVVTENILSPTKIRSDFPVGLAEVIMRALSKEPKERYRSAKDFAVALARAISPATSMEVADWLDALVGNKLSVQTSAIRTMEQASAKIRVPAQSVPPPASGIFVQSKSESPQIIEFPEQPSPSVDLSVSSLTTQGPISVTQTSTLPIPNGGNIGPTPAANRPPIVLVLGMIVVILGLVLGISISLTRNGIEHRANTTVSNDSASIPTASVPLVVAPKVFVTPVPLLSASALLQEKEVIPAKPTSSVSVVRNVFPVKNKQKSTKLQGKPTAQPVSKPPPTATATKPAPTFSYSEH